MKNSKYFPWIVALTAFSVSASAAYYSVFGISKMFAGAATNVMIMAGSLEFSKLVIASLLYSYWGSLNKLLRTYLTGACFILILITSAGIYGFLSSAYQETANKVEILDKQNGSIGKQKELIQAEIKRYEGQIALKDNRMNTLIDIKSRQQGTMDNLISKNSSTKGLKSQMSSIDAEITKLDLEVKTLNDSISSKNNQLKDLDMQSLTLETNQDVAKEIGPLKYIARLTGKTLDQVVNYFIIALMLVFDPLAISLVIAANFLFSSLNIKKTTVTSIIEEEINEDTETQKQMVKDNDDTKEKIEYVEKREEVEEVEDIKPETPGDISLQLDLFSQDFSKDPIPVKQDVKNEELTVAPNIEIPKNQKTRNRRHREIKIEPPYMDQQINPTNLR